MAYVAVKGGEQAIDNAHAWLAEARRGDPAVPGGVAGADRASSSAARWIGRWARARCTTANSAALAVKQAQGDLIEAAFLLRAYRTTLPRFAYSLPVDTAAMRCSAAFPRCSRICRAARCSARPTTTRIGCWISRLAADGDAAAGAARRGRTMRRCRACRTSWATRG